MFCTNYIANKLMYNVSMYILYGHEKVRYTFLNRSFADRVADQVDFWPETDPVNQIFERRIRIPLTLTKNQLKHLNFLLIDLISSDI